MTGLLILLAIAFLLMIAILTIVLVFEMNHPPRRTAAFAVARGWPCDPGDIGLEFEEWMLECDDGAQLPVWDIRTDSVNQLTGVFIHGWGHSRILSLERITPFVPLFNRIVMYDLRGHGEALNSTSRLGDNEEDDLIALINRLESDKVILVGHSMGAVIAIAAAARPNSVLGVIANGPYCDFHTSLIGRLRSHGYPGRPMTDMAMLIYKLRGIHPLGVDEMTMKNLKCPLLVTHGTSDPVAPFEHGKRIAETASNCEFYQVEGAAHTDTHQINADEYARVVCQFVERAISNPVLSSSTD